MDERVPHLLTALANAASTFGSWSGKRQARWGCAKSGLVAADLDGAVERACDASPAVSAYQHSAE